MLEKINKVTVLGPPGSYLDGLSKSMDLGLPIEYANSLEDLISIAEENPDIAILLPIKNTLSGAIYDVVGAFQRCKLRVEAVAKLDVISNIMGIGTLKEASSIAGKDVALKQITKFMPHLERIEMPSTSAAGKYIQDHQDRTMLSVGSKAQAAIYGLDILAEDVQDAVGLNRTTVLVVRNRGDWKFDDLNIPKSDKIAGTAILRIESSKKHGALHKALGEIVSREINLTDIESLNVRGTEDSEFFITISGSSESINDLLVNGQKMGHMVLDILGIYPEPIIYTS